jgi:hypothetical protein
VTNRKGADDPLASARDLIRRNIMPLPVQPSEKNPTIRRWQNLTITEENVAKYFNGADLNVGGRMGEKSGGLCDVDLDCPAALILWKHFLPKTPARYGRHSKPNSHHLYRCAKVDPKATIKFLDGDGKVLIELRTGGGGKGAISVMPGSRHPSGEIVRWDSDGEPAKVDEFGELKTALTHFAVACLLLPLWSESGGHNERALGIGGFLARAGWSEEAIHTVVWSICHYRGASDWAEKHATTAAGGVANLKEGKEIRGYPWLKDTFGDTVATALSRIVGYRSREAPKADGPSPEAGVNITDFLAYMPMHNYMFIPSRELWPGASVNARIAPVPIGECDEKGDEVCIKATTWLDKNRPVEGMTWAPGYPLVIPDRLMSDGGWIERQGVSCFNLYRPPTIALGDKDKAGPWIDHVKKVYPEDADHIINFLAHRVKQPEDKINHGLVLGGDPGIGKDSLLEPVKRAVGPWNFQEISPKDILAQFKGFLKSTVLRLNEAHDLGELSRYEFYESMKRYTASPPDTLRVNEKNIREYYIPNCVGVIITTNYKDALYLPPDDRRHYVAWSRLTAEDFTEKYWDDLWGYYEDGGFGHVAAYLATLPISNFNAKAPPKKTPAFWSIVDINRAPEDTELADFLDAMKNPDAITVKWLIECFDSPEMRASFEDKRAKRSIPHRLMRCGYVAVFNPNSKDGVWRVMGVRTAIYARTILSPADQLDKAIEFARNPQVKKEESK